MNYIEQVKSLIRNYRSNTIDNQRETLLKQLKVVDYNFN